MGTVLLIHRAGITPTQLGIQHNQRRLCSRHLVLPRGAKVAWSPGVLCLVVLTGRHQRGDR